MALSLMFLTFMKLFEKGMELSGENEMFDFCNHYERSTTVKPATTQRLKYGHRTVPQKGFESREIFLKFLKYFRIRLKSTYMIKFFRVFRYKMAGILLSHNWMAGIFLYDFSIKKFVLKNWLRSSLYVTANQ